MVKNITFCLIGVGALPGHFIQQLIYVRGEKKSEARWRRCCVVLRCVAKLCGANYLPLMTFSMAYRVLNLAGMGFTGWLMVRQLETFRQLRVECISAHPLVCHRLVVSSIATHVGMFCALSLAIATFARSSKEGQYFDATTC